MKKLFYSKALIPVWTLIFSAVESSDSNASVSSRTTTQDSTGCCELEVKCFMS